MIVGWRDAGLLQKQPQATFVDLFIGLLPPSEGRILIDEAPLTGQTVRAWLDRLGYVSQFPYIYDATLAQNIAFGLPDEEIDRDKILDCCRKARIDDFLEKLPHGIDSSIGERGVLLSGGQRQRVAIARALYRDPEILILDEATSALDQQSEDAIQRTMLDMSRSITVVVVAHRLTTVEDCGRIIWLEGGKVRQTGPPDEVFDAYRAWMRD
jgi:ABC-type multidrug transport system fused ATPase/permease subunit